MAVAVVVRFEPVDVTDREHRRRLLPTGGEQVRVDAAAVGQVSERVPAGVALRGLQLLAKLLDFGRSGGELALRALSPFQRGGDQALQLGGIGGGKVRQLAGQLAAELAGSRRGGGGEIGEAQRLVAQRVGVAHADLRLRGCGTAEEALVQRVGLCLLEADAAV